MAKLFESLIVHIDNLRDTLSRLTDVYLEVLSILEKEQECIEKSDVNRMDEVIREKVSLGGEVTSLVDKLWVEFNLSVEILGQLDLRNDIADISGLISLIKEISPKDISGLEQKVLGFSGEKLLKSFEKYQETFNSFKPKLSMNKYLINKALNQHKERFDFVCSLVRESESTYVGTGQSKRSLQRSLISCKA